MARDLTAKQIERFTVKSRCMKCVVLFAVNRSQGPQQSRGRKTRSALRLNSKFTMAREHPSAKRYHIHMHNAKWRCHAVVHAGVGVWTTELMLVLTGWMGIL